MKSFIDITFGTNLKDNYHNKLLLNADTYFAKNEKKKTKKKITCNTYSLEQMKMEIDIFIIFYLIIKDIYYYDTIYCMHHNSEYISIKHCLVSGTTYVYECVEYSKKKIFDRPFPSHVGPRVRVPNVKMV